MLGAIRKFSTSIYAKILLGIVVIPFVFWGMGSSFRGGSKNVVLKIDNEKYSTQEFANFINSQKKYNEKVSSQKIDQLLASFIGDKLLEKEYEYFDVTVSDLSLSKLIKNQKEFKRENLFSRTEYEKFLLVNNINAAFFETNLSRQEKKKQLLNFIGSGVLPSKFLVNFTYDKFNQKRNVQLINLNDSFIKEFNFSEEQIKSYYENNIDNYKTVYKTVEILELNPKKLIGVDDFNDLFFKKIDDISDEIIQGEDLNFIVNKYNLARGNTFTIDEFGNDINSNKISNVSKNLIKGIFSTNDSEPTSLIEEKDKFFIIEVLKTENIQNDLNNKKVKDDVRKNLESKTKRKLLSEIISKAQSSFTKEDFIKFSKDRNVAIKKITLSNSSDDSNLKIELVNQIYTFAENKINVVYDIGLIESYLIYVEKIENVSIDEKPEEYEKYLNLSKIRITNSLFNTYDDYIKKKYEIDINYKALNTVKNYFN